MGFYSDLMGFYSDLMGFYDDLWDFIVIHHEKFGFDHDKW